jgi:hypothetical protein
MKLLENHERVAEWIEGKGYALNSRCSWYTMLGVLARDLGNDELYQRYGGKEGLGTQLGKEAANDNRLSESMVELYKLNPPSKLAAKFRALSDYGSDVKRNFQHLVMAMNLHTPPLRSDIANMRIVSEMPPEKKGRYLLVTEQGATMLLYDRVKDKITDVGKDNYDQQVKLSKKVAEIVSKSLNAFPRTYLLSKLNDPDAPIGEAGYQRLLASLDLSVNFLKHSYSTHFFLNHPLTEARAALARKMGTSLSILSKVYSKTVNLPDQVKKEWGIPLEPAAAEEESQHIIPDATPHRKRTRGFAKRKSKRSMTAAGRGITSRTGPAGTRV